MGVDVFSKIYCSVLKMKNFVTLAIIMVTGLSIFSFRYINFDNDVSIMLPRNGSVTRSIGFLRSSGFSNKIVVSLKLVSDKYSKSDLIIATDKLASSISSPLVEKVITGVDSTLFDGNQSFLMKYLPYLFNENKLIETTENISSEKVKDKLKYVYRMSLSPASSFMIPFLRQDPLGLTLNMLDEFKKLSTSSGFRINLVDGHFLSNDLKHSMIIIETSVKLTDSKLSRYLIDTIKSSITQLPEYVRADIIAAHLHTLSNEEIIKKDVGLTVTISSIAFFLFFLFVFRDIRAVAVFIIPFMAIAVSMNLAFFFSGKLSAFIAAMGSVVCGIAVDCSIHIYTALRKNGNHVVVIKKILRPIMIVALTTIAVFVAFLFSNIEGYRQLSVFSIISVVLCFVYSLFLLPLYIKKENTTSYSGTRFDFLSLVFTSMKKVKLLMWIFFIILSAIALTHLHFESDIQNFDGVNSDIKRAEHDFHSTWGGENQSALLVVEGESKNEALENNENLYLVANDVLGDKNFFNIASLFSSEKTVSENINRWNTFWDEERVNKLEKIFIDEGLRYKLTSSAFSPFFGFLRKEVDYMGEASNKVLFETIEKQYIFKNNGKYNVVSFIPDDLSYIDKIKALKLEGNNVFIVSRKAISGEISKVFLSEIVYIGFISAILVFILIFILMKNFIFSCIALVPVITSLGSTLICAYFFHGGIISIPFVVASILVIGLSVDYGVFILYACDSEVWRETYKSVTLSALSTIIGAGALLFARHPVLFTIGETIVVGVLFGYISSIFIVPILKGMLSKGKLVNGISYV